MPGGGSFSTAWKELVVGYCWMLNHHKNDWFFNITWDDEHHFLYEYTSQFGV